MPVSMFQVMLDIEAFHSARYLPVSGFTGASATE